MSVYCHLAKRACCTSWREKQLAKITSLCVRVAGS